MIVIRFATFERWQDQYEKKKIITVGHRLDYNYTLIYFKLKR